MTISHKVAAGLKIIGILPIPPLQPHFTGTQTAEGRAVGQPRQAQRDDTVLFYRSPPNGACGLVPVQNDQKQSWLGVPMPIGVGFSRVAEEKQNRWGELQTHRVLQLQQREASLSNSLEGQSFSASALLTLGAGEPLMWGAILCVVGCLTAFLASTHKIPAAHHQPSCDNRKCLQTLPNASLGPKSSPAENCCSRCTELVSKISKPRFLKADLWILLLFFSLDRYTFSLWKGFSDLGSNQYKNRDFGSLLGQLVRFGN